MWEVAEGRFGGHAPPTGAEGGCAAPGTFPAATEHAQSHVASSWGVSAVQGTHCRLAARLEGAGPGEASCEAGKEVVAGFERY